MLPIILKTSSDYADSDSGYLFQTGVYQSGWFRPSDSQTKSGNGKTINVVDFGADPGDNRTDDCPAIQNAIDAAVPGDEVYFPKGVYNLNSV